MAGDKVEGRRRDPAGAILAAVSSLSEPLPSTVDRKVNVKALTRLLGLRDSDAQYLHKSDAIKDKINELADKEGLKPIGYRSEQEVADRRVQELITKTNAQAREDAQGAVEANHAYHALMIEHRALLKAKTALEKELETSRNRLTEYERVLPYEHLLSDVLRRD